MSGTTDADVLVVALDGMVQHLFAVGFTLASCASSAAEPQRTRLALAIEQLDEVVRELRSAAFTAAAGAATEGDGAGSRRAPLAALDRPPLLRVVNRDEGPG